MRISQVRCIKYLLNLNDRFVGDSASASAITGVVADPRPTAFFVAGVVLYCAYMVAMQPQWLLAGEMWAEMATNYFVNANAPSTLTRLFATDAGYVPFPQRLIALVAQLLKFPATTIPYFYTWTAVLLTGALVSSFCLRPFRALVQNDWLRLLVAMSVLLVADFETRTFINFTYFVAFFAAIASALAMVNKSVPVPAWAWSIPVLMVSKPAVMAALPAMMVIALVSESRFRKIACASLLACLFQIIVLAMHQPPGPAAAASNFGIVEKLAAGLAYFIGFTGALFFGKGFMSLVGWPFLSGICVLTFCGFTFWKSRTPSNALLFVGLSLLLFGFLLNAIALPNLWNLDMRQLAGVPLYRQTIVGYFGVTCVALGLAQAFMGLVTHSRWRQSVRVAPYIFVGWFALSGWLSFAVAINRAPGVPTIFNSQWQLMSEVIDSGLAVCVPVDPIGWVFERNCRLLNTDVNWGKRYEFSSLELSEGRRMLALVIPDEAMKADLMSFAVLVKPSTFHHLTLLSTAQVTLKDGSLRQLFAERKIPMFGGLLLFTALEKIAIKDIVSVVLEFDAPVDMGYLGEGLAKKPAVFWMGS